MHDYEKWISRITYKPGWEFFYVSNEWGHQLQIHATVSHSVTLTPTRFIFSRIIPSLFCHEAFLDWVKVILGEAELHELREFFRYDGELVDDPHKPESV